MENKQPNHYTHLDTPGLLELLKQVNLELAQYEGLLAVRGMVIDVIESRGA